MKKTTIAALFAAALCFSVTTAYAQVADSARSDAMSAATISTPLALGSQGASVTALQQFLITKGYLQAPAPTGYFGNLTAAAVSSFQAANNLPTVGKVGPRTLAMLNQALAAVASMTSTVPSVSGCTVSTKFSTTTGQPCSTGGSTVSSSTPPVAYSSVTGWVAQTGSGLLDTTCGAISAQGDRILIGTLHNGIYLSTDYGVTWNPTSASTGARWSFIAMSANGQKVVATNGMIASHLFYSNDGGTTWITGLAAPTGLWFTNISISANGTKMAAADGHSVWISLDGGTTWASHAVPGDNIGAVTYSGDGSTIYAAGANIWSSTDNGVTWVEKTAAGTGGWENIAVSYNGSRLAANTGGTIHLSTDGGTTWTVSTPPLLPYGATLQPPIASSSDGMTLLVSEFGGYIYESPDGGSTWVQQTSAGVRNWEIPLLSSTVKVVPVYFGNVWTSH